MAAPDNYLELLAAKDARIKDLEDTLEDVIRRSLKIKEQIEYCRFNGDVVKMQSQNALQMIDILEQKLTQPTLQRNTSDEALDALARRIGRSKPDGYASPSKV